MTESSNITSAFVCLQPEPRRPYHHHHLAFEYTFLEMCVCETVFAVLFCWVFFALLSSFHFVTGKGDLLRRRAYRTCDAYRPDLISILMCVSRCRFLHGSFLVSAAYIARMRRPSAARAEVGGSQGGHQQTPDCMSTSTRNLNNRPCHGHKSQPFSSIGPGAARSNFISPRRKIDAGGINSRYIPNTSPTIWAALQGLYFIF